MCQNLIILEAFTEHPVKNMVKGYAGVLLENIRRIRDGFQGGFGKIYGDENLV